MSDSPAVFVRHDQKTFASIRRRDGRAIDGTPGDCLRASVATVLDLEPSRFTDVPHFAMYSTWWEAMRLDARREGKDWACFTPEMVAAGHVPEAARIIACGPSPRGPWWHAVVADHRGRIIHDPHPSRAGLESIEEYLVITVSYEPGPRLKELEW